MPNEDQGMISADVTLPPGASLERTKNVMKQIDGTMTSIDLFAARMSIAGQSMLSGTNGSSHGMMTCSLVPWEQRGDTSTTDVIEMLNKKTGRIKEGKIDASSLPLLPAERSRSPGGKNRGLWY